LIAAATLLLGDWNRNLGMQMENLVGGSHFRDGRCGLGDCEKNSLLQTN
jgi:hypothetical protein